MPNQTAVASSQNQSLGDEENMPRMPLLEHLEELRGRILKSLAGVGVAFAFSAYFGDWLWGAVARPAMDALRSLGYPQRIVFTTPTEAFMTVWVKMPMLASLFLGAPWILYQVWAFVAPGLYRHERRWGAPFVVLSSGLFILGGVFGYFVAFRRGLIFLLGVGKNIGIEPMVSVSDYFDLFIEVMAGLGLVFELPVLICLLTLLRVVTPSFLIRQSRYAVLIIVILAAAVTPTTDFFNLMLFTAPMILMYFVGVLAGYVLVLRRDGWRLPRKWFWWTMLGALLAAIVAFLTVHFGGFHVAG